MNRGIFATASGMVVSQQWMDTIANNLANASTTGFKRDSISFDDAMIRELSLGKRTIGSLGAGPAAQPTVTIFEQGQIMHTGNPLDLAMMTSHGMFAIQVGDQIRYTRNGSFGVDSEGVLVTQQGYPVLDTRSQIIQVPRGTISIADDGNVQVNGQDVAQLGVFDVAREDANDLGFTKIGTNLYQATRPVSEVDPEKAKIRSGALEASNVDAVDSMVQMISLSRAFEMAQRSIQAQDELSQRLIQSLTER